MIFIETTSIWLLLFYPSSMTVPLPTVTHLEMTSHTTEHPVHVQVIQGNHKHLATVVPFLKYKCATSYRNTSGDDHPHDRTPRACIMAFKETTSIWLLFYSSSISVPLPTVTQLEKTTHTTENPVHAQWYSRKPQAFGYCCPIPQV